MRMQTQMMGLVSAAALAVGTTAPAVTTSNLDIVAPGGNQFVQDGQWKAVSFTTDASAYGLDDVVVKMQDAVDASGNFFVSIFSDGGGGVPGSQVTNGLLSGSSNPATDGLYTYTPTAPVSLAAATTYFVVVGVTSGNGDYRWDLVQSFDQTGPWTLGDTTPILFNQGANWTATTNSPGRLSVSATVPEPASLVLLGTGVAALLSSRRRRVG